MVYLSKRAMEMAETYGTVGNMKKLTKEMKAIQKAEKEIKQASANITKILKQIKK